MAKQHLGYWVAGVGLSVLAGCLSAGQFSGESTPVQPSTSSPEASSVEVPLTSAPANSAPTEVVTNPSSESPVATKPDEATGTEAVNCTNPQTQVVMNACAAKAAETADDQLNATYQKLRETLQPAENDLLVAAQVAWIEFRDKNCAFSKERFEDGSIAPLVYSSCIERTTQQRTQELEGYAQGIEDGGLF